MLIWFPDQSAVVALLVLCRGVALSSHARLVLVLNDSVECSTSVVDLSCVWTINADCLPNQSAVVMLIALCRGLACTSKALPLPLTMWQSGARCIGADYLHVVTFLKGSRMRHVRSQAYTELSFSCFTMLQSLCDE